MGLGRSTRHGRCRLIRQHRRLDTSGEKDQKELGSPCLDLDGLSSSDDDIGTLGGLSDLSVTLLCDDAGFPQT